jgi:pectin methylesterase-like acyl-CoA thioesterase
MKRLLLALAALATVATLAHAQARPQLSEAAAARHQIADYLAQGPAPWQPVPLNDPRAWRPDFIVARDGSGTHTTVQAAIDAVPALDQSRARHYIHLQPGVYRERVCASAKAPITLYGSAADAAAAVIVEGRYNAMPKRAGVDAAHPCHPDLAAATFGTPGSATMAIFSDDFHAAHLTVVNDAMAGVRDGAGYPPGAGESGGAQGVALLTQGDRLQLENVRLLGHQDTFFARRPTPDAAARVYVHASLIAGDVRKGTMEAESEALVLEWTRNWSDLVEFEIVPVATSKDMVEALSGHLCWCVVKKFDTASCLTVYHLESAHQFPVASREMVGA